MKLAVSNIAWPREQDAAVADLLREHGVRGIEVAPTKVWPTNWTFLTLTTGPSVMLKTTRLSPGLPPSTSSQVAKGRPCRYSSATMDRHASWLR